MGENGSDGGERDKEQLSERVGSRRGEDSERIEKGGEVTDPTEVPDDGYQMAPTRNNPDRGNGNGSDGDSTGDEE